MALQLVAPSDEIKTACLKKSENFLASARLLLDNERFEESVSMGYYSMYYSVLAGIVFRDGYQVRESYSSDYPA